MENRAAKLCFIFYVENWDNHEKNGQNSSVIISSSNAVSARPSFIRSNYVKQAVSPITKRGDRLCKQSGLFELLPYLELYG